MSSRRRYQKRPDSFITAVRLDVDTEGFTYEKWGGTQLCKPRDWIVDNDGDVYTVDSATFERTYTITSPGVYVKTTQVSAEVAPADGVIQTLEGSTEYVAGDYLVFNDEEEGDGYAVSAAKFVEMYEPID